MKRIATLLRIWTEVTQQLTTLASAQSVAITCIDAWMRCPKIFSMDSLLCHYVRRAVYCHLHAEDIENTGDMSVPVLCQG